MPSTNLIRAVSSRIHGRSVFLSLLSLIALFPVSAARGNDDLTTLDSPLRTIIWQSPDKSGSAELSLVVMAGSLQENDNQLGYAHFVEHMAFNGTRDYPQEQLQQALQALGLDVGRHANAYTDFDSTVYTIRLDQADDAKVAQSIELLAQWAQHVEFDPEMVADEIPVITEEWRLTQPLEKNWHHRVRALLENGSLHAERKPIGTPESIEEVTADKLQAFYRRWYRPANAALVIGGNVDPEQVESLVAEHFSDWTEADTARPEVHDLDIQKIPEAFVIGDEQLFQSRLTLSWFDDQPAPRTREGALEQTMAEAAMDIVRDRIQQRLVSTQGAVNDARWEASRESPNVSHLTLSVRLATDAVEQGMALLGGEWKRVLRDGITPSELDKWRRGYLRDLEQFQDTPEAVTERAVSHVLYGTPMITHDAWREWATPRLAALSADAVNAQLEELLSDEPRVALIGPADIEEKYDAEDLLRLLQAAEPVPDKTEVDSADASPWSIHPTSPGKLVATRQHAGKVTEWLFDNGLSVLHHHSDREPGQVAYALLGEGGFNRLSPEESIHARLAVETLGGSGLRDHDGPSMNEWLTSEGLYMQPSFGFFERGIVGGGGVDALDLQMQLLYIALSEAKADPDTWKHFQTSNIDIIRQLSQSPQSEWIDTLSEHAFQNDAALRSLTVAEIESISSEDINTLYRKHLAGAQNYRLAIVGDIDAEAALESVKATVARLPANEPGTTPPRTFPSERQDGRFVVAGNGERATAGIVRMNVPRSSLDLDYDDGVFLTKWINEALFGDIREQQGLVYRIQASIDGYYKDQDVSVLVVEFASDPDNADKVVSEIDRVLAELSSHAPEPHRLEALRQQVIGEITKNHESIDTQAYELALAPVLDRPTDHVFDLEARVSLPEPGILPDALAAFTADSAVRSVYLWTP